ncbi:MAG: ROK family protein [Propionicimonas sp.]|uniref:polyphosphate--glucose phosphotransferase n=1 Tax=Propionicimonas sp. TaxID=1955623 RepID=UPI002B21B39D|nr:ROK family protein [Propionicimonas sp.]MEA4945311.1 ROK family protein [Propionicimonas sp.]MEA5117451.1 ROK family protein [Propionicimonas sp.]
MTNEAVLGIDIGGSGIKGAPVDLVVGDFADKRLRIPTPTPSTPKKVAGVVARIVESFAGQLGDGPVGVTIPAVVTHGVTRSAANIDKSWIDAPADTIFSERLGRPVHLVNDADAAGIAEVKYGVAKGYPGLVIVTTLGTGIGSAMIMDGALVPNSELGHLEIDGHDAETQASAGAKTRLGLSYEEYIPRLQRYYDTIEKLFSPDLIVVGGGISKDAAKYLPYLKLHAEIVPASLKNRAGIIGAAWLAAEAAGRTDLLA